MVEKNSLEKDNRGTIAHCRWARPGDAHKKKEEKRGRQQAGGRPLLKMRSRPPSHHRQPSEVVNTMAPVDVEHRTEKMTSSFLR